MISQGGLLENKPLKRAESGLEADISTTKAQQSPPFQQAQVCFHWPYPVPKTYMFFPGVSFSSIPGHLCHPQPGLCAHPQAQLLSHSLLSPFPLQEGIWPLTSGENLPPRDLRFLDVRSESPQFSRQTLSPTDRETEAQVVRGTTVNH